MGAELAIAEKGLASIVFWLRRAVIVSKADMVELWAIAGRASEYRVTQVPLGDDCNPEEMARDLALLATDSEDASKFRLAAYRGTERVGDIVVAARHGKADSIAARADRPLAKEEAKEKWISDLVRSHEAMAKLLSSSTIERERMYLESLGRASLRIRELEQREEEVARRHIEVIREDREWSLKQREADIRHKALTDLAVKATDMLPRLADDFRGWAMKKAGVDIPPNAVPHIQKAFEFIREWDADRIRLIGQVFPPAEAQVLMALWEAVTPKPEGAK